MAELVTSQVLVTTSVNTDDEDGVERLSIAVMVGSSHFVAVGALTHAAARLVEQGEVSLYTPALELADAPDK